MTRFTDTGLADVTRRAGDVLDHMERVIRQEPDADLRAALHELREIPAIYGRSGAAFAARAWCDRLIDATPGAVRGQPVQIVYASPDQTVLVDRRYILPERQWASDVLAARFADDHVRFYTLMEQVPEGVETFTCLFRLAEIVAGLLAAYTAPPDGPIKLGLHTVGVSAGPGASEAEHG